MQPFCLLLSIELNPNYTLEYIKENDLKIGMYAGMIKKHREKNL